MKRSRFSDEQIITLIKENESGAKVDELCRRHGISCATFYSGGRREAARAKRGSGHGGLGCIEAP
ncbi:MAG: transposase [Pseudomonadota bacterium]